MRASSSYPEVTRYDFQSYLENTRRLIASELLSLVSGISEMWLHEKIEYAVLSRGKRLRPILVLLGAQSVGGDPKRVMPLALAFELLHTATLVHDDIIDHDKFRRGIPALHEKWSLNDAILVGNALISLAINSAADYGAEVMKTVSKCGLELCDGEYTDTSVSLSTTSEDEYFLKIRKKSASLFRTAAQCGCLAGGGSYSEVESLTNFGEYFGIAYQLKDDLLDLTLTGGFIPKDLRNGRITLPLIHLYETSDSIERETLGNDLQFLIEEKCTTKNVALERVLHNLTTTGSFAYCEQKITEYIGRSIASISSLKNTEFKFYLSQMAKSLEPRKIPTNPHR